MLSQQADEDIEVYGMSILILNIGKTQQYLTFQPVYQVRREDQEKINKFGKLNNRRHEVEDDMKALQVIKN